MYRAFFSALDRSTSSSRNDRVDFKAIHREMAFVAD